MPKAMPIPIRALRTRSSTPSAAWPSPYTETMVDSGFRALNRIADWQNAYKNDTTKK